MKYIGCRDDTMPKTVDRRRYCGVRLRACNNLPQPPKTEMGCERLLHALNPTSQCLLQFWHGVIPTDFYTCFTHLSKP